MQQLVRFSVNLFAVLVMFYETPFLRKAKVQTKEEEAEETKEINSAKKEEKEEEENEEFTEKKEEYNKAKSEPLDPMSQQYQDSQLSYFSDAQGSSDSLAPVKEEPTSEELCIVHPTHKVEEKEVVDESPKTPDHVSIASESADATPSKEQKEGVKGVHKDRSVEIVMFKLTCNLSGVQVALKNQSIIFQKT